MNARSFSNALRGSAVGLVLLGLGIALVAPAVAAEPIVMKMGTATGQDASDTQYQLLHLFKDLVERDSKGRIDVQIYPNSQLGSIPREIEGTQFGSIQGWVGAMEFLVGVDPRFQVLSTPGVFNSTPQFNKTIQDPAFNKALLALGSDKGLHVLGVSYSTPASLMMRKPMKSIADLAGTKIRTLAGPLQSAMIHALGATAIPMPLDQVLPGLQQGAIDGVLAGTIVGTGFKYYTVAPYLLELDQPYVSTITIASKIWFDALPADLQKIVAEDGAKAAHDVVPVTIRLDNRASEEWSHEATTIKLAPAERAAMMAKLANIGSDAFKDQPTTLELYKLMLATAAKYK